MSDLESSKAYTLNLVSQDEMLAFVDSISMKDQGHVLLLSRLPQRRLLEHLDLDKVETYWVTTQDVAGSIQPSLDQIHDLVSSRFDNHEGLAVIEGIEWLISTHGFSDVLKMVMRLKDSLHRKPWTLLLVVAADVLEPVQYSQWQREAPFWEIPKKIEFNLIDDDISESEEDTAPEEMMEEAGGDQTLAFLVRIPREGYSKEIVRRGILQWRRMGLDVSSAEPALFQDSDDIGFQIYQSVERKVRRAVELDNRLELLLEKGYRSEVTKMRFRVRQLTGFDDIESRIDELI
tara:strand:+ start:2348 stop:3217 length:870 start_codon:yes stop_codon:yes gene_type:complete